MKRSVAKQTTHPPLKSRKRAVPPRVPFDALASQTLQLVLKTFLRCGYSAHDIGARAAIEAARIAPDVRPVGSGSQIEQDDWARVVTLWSTEPEYVDENGAPRVLRIRGPAPSIEALLQRVDSNLTADEACNSLLQTGAARRVGRRLAARAHPALVFPPGSPEQSAHHLRVLNAILWNFEHNANLKGRDPAWVERRVTAQTLPASTLTSYSLEANERAMAFLAQEDARMERLVKTTPSDGRSLRAYLHVIFSAPEHDSPRMSSQSAGSKLGSTKQTDAPARTVRAERPRRSASRRRAPWKVTP